MFSKKRSECSATEHFEQMSLAELKEYVLKLRSELEAEGNNVKQLRREKSLATRQVQEVEQHKSSIALKDQKAKLLQEKYRDLEAQREALNKKFEADLKMVTKQKDGEIAKIQCDLKRAQDEVQEIVQRGLSGSARGAFEAKAKLIKDVQELRGAKKQLEENLLKVMEADKNKAVEIQRLQDLGKMEVSRAQKEANQEVRQLLEELKAKDRVITQMEKDLGTQTSHYSKLQMEKETVQQQLNLTKEAESWEKRTPRRHSMSAVGERTGSSELTIAVSSKDDEDKDCRFSQKITELNSQVHKLEESCASLTQDKADLLRKVKELEKKFRPTQDKNRKFLEKNMELTSINRNLEEKIKKLNEDNTRLREQMDVNKRENQKLSRALSFEKLERNQYQMITEELDDLRQLSSEQDKTIMALKLACAEKDRRIELIAYRRRKQRLSKAQQKVVRFMLPGHSKPVAAGIKETYYGYDEDSRSVDSEMSASSPFSVDTPDTTFDEEDVFEEFTREEFEKNYQRLVREHLELEKSYALVQSQGPSGHVDPQRETKDTSWVDEKEKLNKTIRCLKDKIQSYDQQQQKGLVDLQESQEQNEELEFRLLELEEQNEKLTEELKHTITFNAPPMLTENGILQMHAEEKGLVEINLEELKERLNDLKYNKDPHLSRDEKVVLLQARAMLDIADKRLKELQLGHDTLKERIIVLEAEKAELLSAATGVSSDLVIEYEEARNQLTHAQRKIRQLEEEVSELKKQEAVHKYTEEFNQKSEGRYKKEIATLKRQLSSSQEGRDYESELLAEKFDQLKEFEQRIVELEVDKKDLEERLESLQRENESLQELHQDTQSLTESDKDASTLLHSLKLKLHQREKAETELMEKNHSLLEKVAEYEVIEMELTEKSLTLEEEMDALRLRCKSLEGNLEAARAELEVIKQGGLIQGASVLGAGATGSTVEDQDLYLENQKVQSELQTLRNKLKNQEQEIQVLRKGLNTREGGSDMDLLQELTQSKQQNVELQGKVNDTSRLLEQKEQELRFLEKGFTTEMKLAERQKERVAESQEDSTSSSSEGAEILSLKQRIDQLLMTELTLQQRIQDLESANAVHVDNLESMVKQEETLRSQISQLQQEEHQLKEQLAEKELIEQALEEQVKNAELSSQSAAQTIQELEDTRNQLQQRVYDFDEQLQDQTVVADLRSKVEQLELKQQELQTRARELEAQSEAEIKKAKAYEEKITDLEISNRDLRDKLLAVKQNEQQLQKQLLDLEQSHDRPDSNDYQNKVKQLEASERTLKHDLQVLQDQLREQLLKKQPGELSLDDEKNSRIQLLETQLRHLESNEAKLNETIMELHQVEEELKQKLQESGESDSEGASDRKEYERKIARLEASERSLTETVEVLEAQIVELQKGGGASSSAAEKFAKKEEKYRKKIQKLDDEVQELAARESELMEQIYEMKLDNQELQEHIDQLLEEGSKSGSGSGSAAASPRSGKDGTADSLAVLELKDKVSELEKEISNLKDQLLKSKLDALDTLRDTQDLSTIPEIAQSLKPLQDRVNELEQAEAQLKSIIKSKEEDILTLKTAEKRLKEQITMLEKSQGTTMQDRINELEEINKKTKKMLQEKEDILEEQKAREKGLLEKVSALEESLEEQSVKQNKLLEKVDILEQSEDKLMEQVDYLEEQDSKNSEEIERLRKGLQNSHGDEHLRERVAALEKREAELNETIAELEAKKNSVVDKLQNYEKSDNAELRQLREKVDILLDTEERLIEKIATQENVEQELRSQLDEYEKEQSDLEQTYEKLEELEQIVEKYEKSTSEKELKESKERISELEQSEKCLKDRVNMLEKSEADLKKSESELKIQISILEDMIKQMENVHDGSLSELEKSEAVQQAKISGLESTIHQMEKNENSLKGQVSQYQKTEALLKNKINELEKMEASLTARNTNLESQNKELTETVRTVKESPAQTQMHMIDKAGVELLASPVNTNGLWDKIESQTSRRSPSPQRSRSPSRLTPTYELIHATRSQLVQTPPPLTHYNLQDIQNMNRQEMISRIHELQQMEQFHICKIRDLEQNLASFRQAVEVVAVTMETDADIPLSSFRPKTKDSEFEAKVQELVKSEVTLKLKVLEMEKKEAHNKLQLEQAREALTEAEVVYKEDMDQMENKIDKLQKSEARLKNKLQYGSWGQENQALAKIQHLEGLVFDLEKSERKYQRQIQELEERETKLLSQLDNARSEPEVSLPSSLKDTHDKEKYYELIQQVKLLEKSEKDLKETLVGLDKEDSSGLLARIAQLERSERSLKRKVELLENSPDTGFAADDTMWDSPEAILKQRIKELEKMEWHLKQQVVELERDREELHDIARKDKNSIHELNVHIRELQLSEKNLKDQVNHYEVSEGTLQLKVDDLTERIHELEEQLIKSQNVEKQLRVKLNKFEYSKSDMQALLENTKEDHQLAEGRLKKKISDLEQDKRTLMDKVDELTDRVSDLEGVELSLKQKLKNSESADVSLQSKIAKLEHSESTARTRTIELESLNEGLSSKLHSLEEEKSSLMYELSELEMSTKGNKRENDRLNETIKMLKQQLEDLEGNESSRIKKVRDLADKELELHSKIQEYQRSEEEWRDRLKRLEENEAKLKLRIQELEASLSSAQSKIKSSSGAEKENSLLQAQIEEHQRTLRSLNQKNNELEEKLKLYEYSHANKDMAVVPRPELSQLRAQVTLLEGMEKNVARLEKSEAGLKQAVAQLRQGKDACGHESELAELKEQVNKYNAAVKAHELLKKNYEEVKSQLAQLHGQIKDGDVSLKTRASSSNKSVQVKLADSITLKQVSPEFRYALRVLGTRFPEAYQEFVKYLHPSYSKNIPGLSQTPKMDRWITDEVHEEFILPQESSATQSPQRAVQVSAEGGQNRKALVMDLVDKLPLGQRVGHMVEDSDASSMDEDPVAGLVSKKRSLFLDEEVTSDEDMPGVDEPLVVETMKGRKRPRAPRPIDVAGEDERKKLIGELVEKMPSGGKNHRGEDPIWQAIESRGPTGSLQRSGEDNFWADIEKKSGSDVDDVTLSFMMRDETDDNASEVALSSRSPHNRSGSSVQSDSDMSLPPLPTSLPPAMPMRRMDSPGNESYYLPGSQQGDDITSMDGFSEFGEDDEGRPRSATSSRRAKSLDRDSDFSEVDHGHMRKHGKLGTKYPGSLDSIPDSGLETLYDNSTHSSLQTKMSQEVVRVLQDKVVELETRLKSKEKEIEVARANQKETEKYAQDADDALATKAKLKDADQKLETERRKTKGLEKEIDRLKQEAHNKQREIEQLQAETEKLDKILRAKNIANGEGQVEQLKGELQKSQYELLQREKEVSDLDSSGYFLKVQLEESNRELSAKHEEIESLTKELHRRQEEVRATDSSKLKAETSLRAAQRELELLKDTDRKLTELQQHHSDLQREHAELVKTYRQLEKSDEDKTALEKIVLKLRGQLKDLERIDLERHDLEQRLKVTENHLREKSKSESEITREHAKLRHKVDDLEKEVLKCRSIERDYENIRSKFNEMEQIKSKALTSVTPLRAKVIRLAQKCRTKDNLIHRLAAELRHYGEPSDLIAEADRVQAQSASEEYSRPISPLTTQAVQAFEDNTTSSEVQSSSPLRHKNMSRIPRRTRSGSESSGGSEGNAEDLHTLLNGDADNLFTHRTSTESLNLPRIPKSNTRRANSMDNLIANGHVNGDFTSIQPVSSLNNSRDKLPQTKQRDRTAHRKLPKPQTDQYRAVKDYNPEHFSRSGHQRLELPLKEGQHVKVLGPIDEKGYFEAEVNGKIGLVPAIYLQPVYPTATSLVSRRLRQVQPTGNHVDSSPEQILAMHQHLQHSHTPSHNAVPVPYPPSPSSEHQQRASITHPAFRRSPGLRSPVSPPLFNGNHPAFHPLLPSSGSLLHGVTAPGGPGGLQQGGLFSHGQPQTSPTLTSGVRSLPPVDQNQSINTAVTPDGAVSTGPPDPPTNFGIQRILGNHSVLLSWTPPEMDEMARSKGHTVQGYKIYINNKDKQTVNSPHMMKALVERLDLHKPQHFSIQTIAENGHRSRMVDTLFDDVLSVGDHGSDRESTGDADISSVVSGSNYEDGERRVFLAVYDYSPAEHSPNTFPNHELAFQTGDIIATYGSVRNDGFFHGKVRGKKGLVPASFIEEVAVLRSRSRRSLSNSSTGSQHYASSQASSRVSGEMPRVKRSHSHQGHDKAATSQC